MLEPTHGPAPPHRPRIGITAWRRPLPTPLGEATDLYTLGVEYAAAVQAAGGLALILPHGDDAEAMLDTLDGLVLSGGGDLDPRSYGDAPAEAKDARLDADQWEITLVRAAESRRLPVLGICRGMQVLAVAHGGRLAADITGRDGHPDMGPLSAPEILGARHPVAIDATSLLGRIYGGVAQREVNTIHHQAVLDPGDLKVSARSGDGMIEAVEASATACALGVQWHPEKMPADAAADERRLFEHLIAEARAYAGRRRSHGA